MVKTAQRIGAVLASHAAFVDLRETLPLCGCICEHQQQKSLQNTVLKTALERHACSHMRKYFEYEEMTRSMLD